MQGVSNEMKRIQEVGHRYTRIRVNHEEAVDSLRRSVIFYMRCILKSYGRNGSIDYTREQDTSKQRAI